MMTTHAPWKSLTISAVGSEQASPRGHHYVECATDSGTVAFWASPRRRVNVDRIRDLVPPFSLTVSKVRHPTAPYSGQHAFWIPDTAELQVTRVETLDSSVADVASHPVSPPAHVGIDELTRWRRTLLEMLDVLDPSRAEAEGVGARIGRLSHGGVIPRHVAALMRSVTEARNVVEYERKVLSPSESAAVAAAWAAIQAWAGADGATAGLS